MILIKNLCSDLAKLCCGDMTVDHPCFSHFSGVTRFDNLSGCIVFITSLF